MSVVDNEDQNIDEDQDEASEVKINSTICFLDLTDYIIKLFQLM